MDNDGKLCQRTRACQDLFKEVSSIVNLIDDDWLEDRFADFNWWAYGLRALKIGRSSLDHRVRNRPDVQQVISNLLNSLSHSLKRCLDISQGYDPHPSLRQPGWPPGDTEYLEISSEPRSGSVSPWSELSDGDSGPGASARGPSLESPYFEQKFYIRTYIDLLFKISIAIRRSGKKDRYLKADSFLREHQEETEYQELREHLTFLILVSPYEQNLINTLQEQVRLQRIPAVVEIIVRSWLADPARITSLQWRLIESNVVRRNRILYARRSLEGKEPPCLIQIPLVEMPVQDDLQPRVEHEMTRPDLNQHETPRVQSQESHPERLPGVVTPSVPLTATNIGSDFILLPTAPKKGTSANTRITRTGASQDYPHCPGGKGRFQCPYCTQVLSEEYRLDSKWRGHVAQDLNPYACIYENCRSVDDLYSTKDEWLKHMSTEHSIDQWVCDHCSFQTINGEDLVFDNEKEWKHHTVSAHKDFFSTSQLPLLAKMSKRRLMRQAQCPICRHPPSLTRPDVDEHIAEHMHWFALRALPWDVHGGDDELSNGKASLGSVSDHTDLDDPSDTYDHDNSVMIAYDAIEQPDVSRCFRQSKDEIEVVHEDDRREGKYPAHDVGHQFQTVKKYHLVVGLDFGTTYTGIAYAMSRKEDIYAIEEWPGTDPQSPKREKQAPSVLAYSSVEVAEQDSSSVHWGYQVQPNMEPRCEFMKLHLDKNAPPASDGVKNINNTIESGFFKLPVGRTASKVTEDYLTEVFKYTRGILTRELEKPISNATHIEFWITTPVSGDEAQYLTLRAAESAAKRAGFAESGMENFFSLVAEPEAALIATLLESNLPGEESVEPGDGILVCDCGGGQTDFAIYKIVKTKPRYEWEQITVAQGPKCGAARIDRNLHTLMEYIFKEHFTRLAPEKKNLGSEFMQDFERHKKEFEQSSRKQKPRIMRLLMEGAKRSPFYRPQRGHVILPTGAIEKLFDPIVQKISDHLSKQVEAAGQIPGLKLTDVALVGGFGDSPYLRQKLQTWCDRQSSVLNLRTLEDSWGAIARGAVAFGLDRAVVNKRRSQNHYGIACMLPFNEGEDDERDKRFLSIAPEKPWCTNCVQWIVKKGTEISGNTIIGTSKLSVELLNDDLQFYVKIFSSQADPPPRKCTDHTNRVAHVNITLDPSDLQGAVRNSRWVKFDFEVEVLSGWREETVLFTANSRNKVLNKVKASFFQSQ